MREIEILVNKAAGGVGVGVDDERRIVDGARARRNTIGRNRAGFGCRFLRRGLRRSSSRVGVLGSRESREEQGKNKNLRTAWHEGDEGSEEES